ncbi:hypothetical protein, partial [Xanthovirga aplysinae]|uniref:hypothetical protein n=1 Tax=Xanthovirga aplysinae TaxID=2529853 RepID=UPI0016571757
SKGFKIFKKISYFLLLTGIGLSLAQKGKIGRDKKIISDIYTIMDYVTKGSTIGLCPKMEEEWGPIGYFHRYGEISLDPSQNKKHSFYLSKKGCLNDKKYLKGYEKVPVNLEVYELYKIRNKQSKQ